MIPPLFYSAAAGARITCCVRHREAASTPALGRELCPAPLCRLPARLSARPDAQAPAVGAKLVPAALSIGVGLLLRFVVPCPDGVSMQAWQLLSIFVSTITGLVLEPLPVGAWSFLGLTTAARPQRRRPARSRPPPRALRRQSRRLRPRR